MSAVRRLRLVTVLGAVVFAGGCGSERASPTGLSASLVKPTGLLPCSPLPSTSVKQTIGLLGGTMQIGPHVFVVPPGALLKPVTISAKTAGGTGNAVAFKPEGLTFSIPAYLTLSYANCSTDGALAAKQVAYTTDWLGIISLVPSLDDLLSQQVTGQLSHFSNYAIAW